MEWRRHGSIASLGFIRLSKWDLNSESGGVASLKMLSDRDPFQSIATQIAFESLPSVRALHLSPTAPPVSLADSDASSIQERISWSVSWNIVLKSWSACRPISGGGVSTRVCVTLGIHILDQWSPTWGEFPPRGEFGHLLGGMSNFQKQYNTCLG